jgi:hypothetical protein
MPLKVSDGMGAWIDDFKKSDAPQFKGKSDKERRDQAIAAYMSAKNEQVDESSDAYGKSLEKEKEKRLTSNDQEKLARFRRMMDREKTKVAREPKGEYDRKVGSYLKKKYNKEDVEHLEENAAVKAKAEKSGMSYATLMKVYRRGVAAWNSGHRPGTTPQQWGLARVNSYATKGKGTYGGADKDLRKEEIEEKSNYMTGLSKSTAKARAAHWKKADKLSDKDPEAYKPAPGDATAKTKPSVHTNKFKKMFGEETTFEVEVEGLPTMYVKAASPGEVKANLRKIVKQPSMITGVSRVTDADMKKVFRDKAQGREKENDDLDEAKSEDDMPASPDEAGMAMDQAKFIGYVAKEISEYIGGKKEFPEWMQNKLSGFHEKAKDMHAVLAGKYDNKSVDEAFEPHMMYNPKTGKGYKAEKEADHLQMKKIGYTHIKPEMDEGKKPDYKAPGWMLRADPKLKAKVDANKAKNKEFKKLVGTKKEQASMCEQCGKVHEGNCSS